MEKLIKIKARMIDGSISKYRTTNFIIKPFRSNSDEANKTPVIYIKLASGLSFICKNIEVEQKEIEPILLSEHVVNTSEKKQIDAVLAANNISS